jgi:hypothetical protein
MRSNFIESKYVTKPVLLLIGGAIYRMCCGGHHLCIPASRKRSTQLFPLLIGLILLISFIPTLAQTLPSETPQEFKPTNYGLEYERRDVMIPMRDGVKKLHTSSSCRRAFDLKAPKARDVKA